MIDWLFLKTARSRGSDKNNFINMITTIIFDFGDVFINLDKEGAYQNILELFDLEELPEEFIAINNLYEQGLIETEDFLNFYEDNFPHLNQQAIIDAWNFIILDFPKHRFEWLKKLKASKDFNLLLLSNTNQLHIDYIKASVPFYSDFKDCFDKFYLSHEINLRKPNDSIFNFVLEDNCLKAADCLFIDDTSENTKNASNLGFNIWNNDPKTQDVIDLFKHKPHLF